jgi:hypothetical protein
MPCELAQRTEFWIGLVVNWCALLLHQPVKVVEVRGTRLEPVLEHQVRALREGVLALSLLRIGLVGSTSVSTSATSSRVNTAESASGLPVVLLLRGLICCSLLLSPLYLKSHVLWRK